MKDNLMANIAQIESSLKNIRGLIKLTKGDFIYKASVKETVKNICRKWFEEIEPLLIHSFSFNPALIEKYHTGFDKLLRLSLSANARKNSYLDCIEQILDGMRLEVIKPIIKSGNNNTQLSGLYTILEHVTDKEKDYLEEAIKCANLMFIRASIILGWCAAISRLHSVIEKVGFDKFNEKTIEMKNKTEGRYKRYDKRFAIGSINELRAQVFDTDLLWILEYMDFIDANQHDRLSLCFTMRNNCAHPGDAPISTENLISFYSDLDNIIFKNTKFSLNNTHS